MAFIFGLGTVILAHAIFLMCVNKNVRLFSRSKMETMVNYDLKNGARTTPFIGKDSAV